MITGEGLQEKDYRRRITGEGLQEKDYKRRIAGEGLPEKDYRSICMCKENFLDFN